MMETRRNGRKEKAVANGIGSQTKKRIRFEINLNPLIKKEEGTSVIKKERKWRRRWFEWKIDMVEEFHHSLANVEVRKFVDESW